MVSKIGSLANEKPQSTMRIVVGMWVGGRIVRGKAVGCAKGSFILGGFAG